MLKELAGIPFEEIARRGNEIYERKVRPVVEAGNHGKVVAIDIHSEDYALGDTAVEATDLVRSRQPDAVIWALRVGFPSLYSIGFFPTTMQS